MPKPTILLKRSLIFLHRWVGVALSVVFMLWFASGIVMMYWGMPGVSGVDRLEHAPALDASTITLSPEEAYAILGREQPPGSVELTTHDGRPLYRFGGGGGGGRGKGGGGGGGKGKGGGRGAPSGVYADDGTPFTGTGTPAMADRVAAAWAKLPLSEGKREFVTETDQWTVGGQLRTLRPLYKYTFSDGQEVYISGRDAQVVQYTTKESRFWAYLGAIPHWIYFTQFRVHQPQWFAFVVWSSAIGTGLAIVGMIIGIWMYSPKKIYRHAGVPTSIPYKGQKRWHTIFGLVFGITVSTWAFSGLLSMGPFEFVDWITGTGNAKGKGKTQAKGQATAAAPNFARALRGAAPFDIAAYRDKDPRDVLATVSGRFEVKQLAFSMFDGNPLYIATNGQGEDLIIPVYGDPATQFNSERVFAIIQQEAGSNVSELRWMDQYDSYYQDRHGKKPLPVIYAQLKDQGETRYYIDPKSASVVGTYNSRGWVNRWLYHGLHSLDFPWLMNHRPLWDIVVIAFMLGGTALCVTSLVLTWRVLKKKVAGVLPNFTKVPQNDDLSSAS